MTDHIMTVARAQDLLDDIDNSGQRLTDWECDYVDSMLRRTDKGEAPTPAQAKVIWRIWKDRTG